jgi:hypothetical protein
MGQTEEGRGQTKFVAFSRHRRKCVIHEVQCQKPDEGFMINEPHNYTTFTLLHDTVRPT